MANFQDGSDVMPAPDTSLQMDYWTEELSESQKAHYSRSQKEYSDIMRKVSDFIFKEKGDVLERGSDVLVLQGSAGTPATSVLSSLVSSVAQASTACQSNKVVTSQSQPQIPKLQSVPLVLQGGQAPSGTRVVATTQGSTAGTFQMPQTAYQLVMDPRLGLIVGEVSNQKAFQVIATAATSPPGLVSTVTTSSASLQTTPAPQRLRPKPTSLIVKTTAAPAIAIQAPSTKTQAVKTPSATTAATTSTMSTSSPMQGQKQRNSSLGVSASTPVGIPQPIIRPNAHENTSVGGLSAGNSKKNTNDDGKTNASGPDSKELTFNKLSGKTFPSLVVLAKPHLRVSEMTQTKINKERSALDAKVKSVLMYNAAKFCEWLIQQGLVKSDQFCSQHSEGDGPLALKLGTYSDVAKFPYSGGYVWVNDCCPQRFVSVFSGSIFEGAPHPPTVLLKLMYHWCCQTNVQNVVQWVKVDNFYVKNFFTHMRSVCIAAVHENFQKLGGPQKRVEVGVISLGTTSQDGNQRQVKVEVLGVMDTESKLVRLRAVEPLQEAERNYKRRFVKILEPLRHWVHLDSTIVTDFTVDKGTLLSMGFNQVLQTTIPDPPTSSSKLSNQNIMEYLRRIVPRMFQNTLSLLSRQIIQQFLDELVWRELWGSIPSQAFESLVSNLAAQTKLDKGENLIVKLGKIAANPFKSWEYKHWNINGLDISTVPLIEQISNPTLSKSVGKTESSIDADDEYVFSIALPKPYNYEIGEELRNRLNQALKKIDTSTTLRKLVEEHNLPRSLLYERTKEFLKYRLIPAFTVFTEDEEEDIKEYLMTLYEWGYPFARWDIQMAVKQYLEACGRVETRFKDNFPGEMWLERFLTRHPLIRARLCSSVPSRGSPIDTETVKQYLLNISSELESVPPQNILNIMEIGLTGDPLKSMTIELRDIRYPVGRRKVKSSTAIMVACTAVGKVLPIFIIFEGKLTTIEKGDFSGEYYATQSGWFDEIAFHKWIETVLFPWADKLEGKKVVVGDSLAKLFTVKSLALCMDKNITFVSMPCNISGVLSPIDVVLCEKLRTQWRSLMRSWSLANGDRCISVDNYPTHIKELFTSTIGAGVGQQIRNAFKVIGLHPFNSTNTMRALENAGVNLSDSKPCKQSNEAKFQGDASKRKRIFIGTDEPTVNKKPGQKSLESTQDYVDLKETLKNTKDLVSLVAFYYGTLPPDNALVSSEFKIENLNAKCPLCSSSVQDNLTLMKHLLAHSATPTAQEISNINMCIYCAKIFPSSEEKDNHAKEVHKSLSLDETACLICCEKMSSKESLIMHMRRTHNQLELPFSCTICSFRCSEQFTLVDHFYEVHKNGEKLQCPYCLKCVAVGNQGKKLAANVFFFMHHVKKHQLNNTSKKCDKCSLSFIHKGIIKEHINSDHKSFHDNPNVVPYTCKSKVSIMISRPRLISEMSLTGSKSGSNLLSKNANILASSSTQQAHFCIECDTNLFGENHFSLNDLMCKQCTFCTCCSKAMKKHSLGNVRTHPGGCRPGSIRTAPLVPLPNAMHCMCGFKARDGNVLATHLISCNRTVAYPSASTAVEALVASRLSASFAALAGHGDKSGAGGNTLSKVENGRSSQNKSLQKDPPIVLSKLGSLLKKSMEAGDSSGRAMSSTETEDDSSRDRPLSRASSSGSSSSNRKRSAVEAEIESSGSVEVKEKKSAYEDTLESHSLSESNHSC
ncbi:uncharacterized protein LOC117646447 isoform X2 [Thrips palmi]|uniref:Uncharacterized protein LOC117646447 isoform X2 n=1 Tax=Thrips palmi TaxID=161013 RepID=A0A6P8Z0Y5_THRPL|nr:uncharacterized protein LOC117646447 isoform X2 [Thrips palmi]